MRFAALLCATVGVAQANWKSGAVTGYEKFTYGKFITRMRAPNRMGTVSSFFTYWNGPNFYTGGWNELDFEIVPSVMENPLSMNAIYGDGNKKNESHDYVKSFDPLDDWHIYEIEWHPKFISWSIDNKEVRRIPMDDPSVKYMNKGQSLMMNFWTPTFDSWGHGFNAADMPWYCIYDYVETYTYNFKTNGYDFHWKDDFNTFDTNRWHKSDNTTFDHNSTTFRAEQTFTHGGNLVLKMEPDNIPVDGDWHSHGHSSVHWTPEKGEPVKDHEKYHETHYDHGWEHGYGYGPHFEGHHDGHHQAPHKPFDPEFADLQQLVEKTKKADKEVEKPADHAPARKGAKKVDHYEHYDPHYGWAPESWYNVPHPTNPFHGQGPVPGFDHSLEPWTSHHAHGDYSAHDVHHGDTHQGEWHGPHGVLHGPHDDWQDHHEDWGHHDDWHGDHHGDWHGDDWYGADHMYGEHHIWDEVHPEDPYVKKARASLKPKAAPAPKKQEKPAEKKAPKKAAKKAKNDEEENYGSFDSYHESPHHIEDYAHDYHSAIYEHNVHGDHHDAYDHHPSGFSRPPFETHFTE